MMTDKYKLSKHLHIHIDKLTIVNQMNSSKKEVQEKHDEASVDVKNTLTILHLLSTMVSSFFSSLSFPFYYSFVFHT